MAGGALEARKPSRIEKSWNAWMRSRRGGTFNAIWLLAIPGMEATSGRTLLRDPPWRRRWLSRLLSGRFLRS